MKTIIFHNNRCSKSREALTIVQSKDEDVHIVDYLQHPPTASELAEILEMLGNLPAEQLVRKQETLYKDKFAGVERTNEEWIALLAEHPKLIERPIVIRGNKAVIGRPPSLVLDLF